MLSPRVFQSMEMAQTPSSLASLSIILYYSVYKSCHLTLFFCIFWSLNNLNTWILHTWEPGETKNHLAISFFSTFSRLVDCGPIFICLPTVSIFLSPATICLLDPRVLLQLLSQDAPRSLTLSTSRTGLCTSPTLVSSPGYPDPVKHITTSPCW